MKDIENSAYEIFYNKNYNFVGNFKLFLYICRIKSNL